MPGGDAAQERLRRSFYPTTLRLLFVGESPPASGRFFYQADSGLYRAFRDVFQAVDPSISDDTFLKVFQASGCYLIDLCPKPVDDLDPRPRRAACKAGEASLARAIRLHRPPMIATLLRSIEGNVARAVASSEWEGPVLQLPYPGRWARHKKGFTEALEPVIRAMLSLPKPSGSSSPEAGGPSRSVPTQTASR